MIIDKNTPKLVIEFISKKDIETIKSKVDISQNYKSIFTLKIKDVIEMMEDDYLLKVYDKCTTLFEYIGFLKGYEQDFNSLNKFIKMNEIAKNNEEEQASVGVIFPNFQEYMLLKTAKFFHCKNFDEVGDIPFADFLLIYKDKSSKNKFQNNLTILRDRKNRLKK